MTRHGNVFPANSTSDVDMKHMAQRSGLCRLFRGIFTLTAPYRVGRLRLEVGVLLRRFPSMPTPQLAVSSCRASATATPDRQRQTSLVCEDHDSIAAGLCPAYGTDSASFVVVGRCVIPLTRRRARR